MGSYDEMKWESFTNKLDVNNTVYVTCLKEIQSYISEMSDHKKSVVLFQLFNGEENKVDMTHISTDLNFNKVLFVDFDFTKQEKNDVKLFYGISHLNTCLLLNSNNNVLFRSHDYTTDKLLHELSKVIG